MRRPSALLLAAGALLCCAPAAVAADGDGGASAPDESGGADARRPLSGLLVRHFAVSPSVRAGGRVRIAYRVDGAPDAVDVRVDVLRAGRVALRLALGRRATGRDHVARRSLRALGAGAYTVRLRASDAAGRRLAHASGASGSATLQVLTPPPPRPPAPRPAPAPAPTRTPSPAPAPAGPGSSAGVFPVRGAWSFGSEGAQFGAPRGGREHRGQDIIAAEGTPIVSPRPGAVYFKDFQKGGAGHYVVIRGDDGRDYVFMHLVAPSPLEKGARVAAGQQIGQVGNTGSSSGAHLHFEIWPGGWYAPGAQPIDPRPELEAWARG